MDEVTFGLAYLAYLLLCAYVLWPQKWLRIVLPAVLIGHVGCVWGYRFGWSVEAAIEKSIAGFLIFHAAFFTILLAAAMKEPGSRRVMIGAWFVVNLGAIPAPFVYDFISALKIPMIAALVATISLGLWKGFSSASASDPSQDSSDSEAPPS